MKARDDFDAQRSLDPDSEDAKKAVTHANDVAKFLRENVVQGQANDNGRYSTCSKLGIEARILIRHRAEDTRAHGTR